MFIRDKNVTQQSCLLNALRRPKLITSTAQMQQTLTKIPLSSLAYVLRRTSSYTRDCAETVMRTACDVGFRYGGFDRGSEHDSRRMTRWSICKGYELIDQGPPQSDVGRRGLTGSAGPATRVSNNLSSRARTARILHGTSTNQPKSNNPQTASYPSCHSTVQQYIIGKL